MKRLAFFLLAVCTTVVSATDKKYPVSDIPENMKKGMYAVIRERVVKITIIDISHYNYYSRQAVTILNKNAERLAYEGVDYDKLSKVTLFKGTAYDADGNVLKRLKTSEIYDRSHVSSASLFEDTRVKHATLEQSIYPYTVEFEYEQQLNYLYDFPDFSVYNDDEVSTQKASYSIVFNKAYPPRFKTFRVAEPAKSTEGSSDVLTWNFENVIPEKFEPMAGPARQAPYIMSAPSTFEYSGYKGDMSSWESYAKWQTDLLQGRDELPQTTKDKILSITSALPSTEQKIRAVYEYVQSKTRYVNISLGIGGLQPFPAKVVDEVGYGDCKGLSNYTVALLKTINIPALYATIRAGEGEHEVIEDFPSHQSNHVIVAVPNGRDTIWLECTSQTISAGYLGDFTDNRKALINTPSGGKLVRTPRYDWQHNTITRTIKVAMETSGDATAKLSTVYTGLQTETEGLGKAVVSGFEKQKEWLQYSLSISNFDVLQVKMKETKGRIPQTQVDCDLWLRKIGAVNGKRVFINPSLFNRNRQLPAKAENRKHKVHLGSGYLVSDSITFTLPENLSPEFIPERITIKSTFGEYEATYQNSAGALTYIRKLKMNGGVFPPESFNELIEFFKNINKADNTKVVFVNKT